jgi:hypothetical protein
MIILFKKNYFLPDYGDFSIEDVFPLYGPMCGNQKVCVELKGYLPKDLKSDLNIYITENQNNWFHQIENIKKNRNNFTFLMPTFPYTFMNRAKVDIIITYKQDTIYQSSYIYTRKLDGMNKDRFQTIFYLSFFCRRIE